MNRHTELRIPSTLFNSDMQIFITDLRSAYLETIEKAIHKHHSQNHSKTINELAVGLSDYNPEIRSQADELIVLLAEKSGFELLIPVLEVLVSVFRQNLLLVAR
jgi:hypothetical protein